MTGSRSNLRDRPSDSVEQSPDAARSAFDKGAASWSDYLSTPFGRLRHEVSLHYLSQHLEGLDRGSRVLDAGGGTGSYAATLAERGFHVCLLDFSPEMLTHARERILSHNPDLLELIYFRQGDVEEIGDLLPADYFDLVLCHTLLEYLTDPLEAARALANALKRGGLISLLLANPEADVMRSALLKHDARQALLDLQGSISSADLFGLSRRAIPPETVAETLGASGMVEVADYGVRVVADYLPARDLDNPQFYGELFELEKTMGRLLPYKLIARYRQLLMRKAGPV